MADYQGLTPNRLLLDWYEMNVAQKKRKAPGLEGVPTTFPEPPASPAQLAASTVPSTDLMKYVKPGVQGPTTFPAPQMGATPPVSGTVPPETGGATWSQNLEKGLQDPAKMGLLAAGLSLMSAPPRRVPYSAGELIGTAGLQGLNYFRQALEDKRRGRALDIEEETRKEAIKERAESRKDLALDREERRRIAEESLKEKTQYYQDIAESKKMNAETLKEMREVNSATKQALDKPVPENVRKFFGLEEGTTIRDFKEMGGDLDTMQRPPKTNTQVIGPDDSGKYSLIDRDTGKVIREDIRGGKTKTIPKGTTKKTGNVLREDAITQWKLENPTAGREPTPKEIYEMIRVLQPTGKSTGTEGTSVRSQMLTGGAPQGTAKRVKMPDGTILYFDKDGKRIK